VYKLILEVLVGLMLELKKPGKTSSVDRRGSAWTAAIKSNRITNEVVFACNSDSYRDDEFAKRFSLKLAHWLVEMYSITRD